MFFFDIKTGKRFSETLDIPYTQGGYDYIDNTFWFYKSDSATPVLKSFKVDGFKSKAELSDSTNKNFNEFAKKRTSKTIEEQKSDHRIATRTLEGFLKKLGNKRVENFIPESKQNHDIHQSLFMIMYAIGKGCEQMDVVMSEFDSLYPDLIEERLACQTKLFRSEYASSICGGNTFVAELVKALEPFADFTEIEMTDNNILEQYEFCWILKLTHRFMLSLDRLKLTLTEVADDTELRNKLLDLISKITQKFSIDGINEKNLKGNLSRDEISAIWSECFAEAGGIQNVLLNLSSESSDDLIKKIHEAANSLENNKISISLINFLKFLSQSDSIKNVMGDQSLENIFNVC